MNRSDLSEASIGIFDSGFGGLTVMRALKELLPNESILYFGDTARLPYGSKSQETIIRYCQENFAFMATQGIKLLVVACHTASSLALEELRQKFDIPILGVVKPGVEEVLKTSKTDHVAILGTRATISSGVYQREIKERNPSMHLTALACPLFVPLVEEGFIDHPITESIIKEYLDNLKDKPIDSVLLACTHYPLLKSAIQQVVGKQVNLIDPAYSCAQHVKLLLEDLKLLKAQSGATYTFYVSDAPDKFKELGQNFLGSSIEEVLARPL